MYLAQAPGQMVVAAPAPMTPSSSAPNVWGLVLALVILGLAIYFLRRLERER